MNKAKSENNPLAGVGCFKYQCRGSAHTVELEDGPGAETFPSALCYKCARRPNKVGTFEDPIIVPVRR